MFSTALTLFFFSLSLFSCPIQLIHSLVFCSIESPWSDSYWLLSQWILSVRLLRMLFSQFSIYVLFLLICHEHSELFLFIHLSFKYTLKSLLVVHLLNHSLTFCIAFNMKIIFFSYFEINKSLKWDSLFPSLLPSPSPPSSSLLLPSPLPAFLPTYLPSSFPFFLLLLHPSFLPFFCPLFLSPSLPFSLPTFLFFILPSYLSSFPPYPYFLPLSLSSFFSSFLAFFLHSYWCMYEKKGKKFKMRLMLVVNDIDVQIWFFFFSFSFLFIQLQISWRNRCLVSMIFKEAILTWSSILFKNIT